MNINALSEHTILIQDNLIVYHVQQVSFANKKVQSFQAIVLKDIIARLVNRNNHAPMEPIVITQIWLRVQTAVYAL